ncbi:MAG TPA: BrnT family toxin [Thermoanaerobaculia bacterium]
MECPSTRRRRSWATRSDGAIPTQSIRWRRSAVVIGMSERQRVLVVAYTADADTIRVISARQATRKERNFYEEG